jgi:hypothetical protein
MQTTLIMVGISVLTAGIAVVRNITTIRVGEGVVLD